MSRLLRYVVAVVLLAAGVLLVLRLPLWSRQVVESRLSSFFQRPVSVAAVHYHLLPRVRIELRSLRVGGAVPGAPPFLEARRLVLEPRLKPLWERKALLARLHVVGLRLRVNAYRDGGHDLPAFRTEGTEGHEVRIDRLVVEDSDLVLNHQRVPLDLRWHEVSARLFGSEGGALSGRLAIGEGALRFGGGPPLPVSLQTELGLRGSRLLVRGARVRSSRTDLLVDGHVDWSQQLSARLQVRGEVDLGVVDHHVTRTGLGLAGRGHADGELALGPDGLRFSGKVSGEEGAFQGQPVPRFAGQVAWGEKGLQLRDLELEALGGVATVQVDVPRGPAPAAVEAQFAGLDAEALAAFLFEVGRPGLGASASGQASLSWPRGRVRDLSGTVELALEATGDGRTPLAGRVAWRAQHGEQQLELAELRTPSTQTRLSGTIGRDLAAGLAVEMETGDLAAADALLVRLRQALGNAVGAPVGLSGSGRFEGQWRGTLGEPVFEGRFHGQDLQYKGVGWGRGEWTGTLAGGQLASRSLTLRKDGALLWVDGTSETGDYGGEDSLDVRLRLVRWPAQDLLRALSWDVDLTGALSGEAELRGRRSAPLGSVRVSAERGAYYGVAFEELLVESRLDGDTTEVRRGRARVGGGRIDFRGTVAGGGIYDGEAEVTTVETAAFLRQPSEGPGWGGPVSGRVVLQGTLSRPRLQASLRAPSFVLGRDPVGAVEASLVGKGDGTLALQARCLSETNDLAVSGSVAATPPYAADLRLQAARVDLAPLLRMAQVELPAGAGGKAMGEVSLRGALSEPSSLSGEVEIGTFALQLPEYPVRNRGPLRAALRSGRLEVVEARLFGEGTDLKVEGSLPVASGEPLRLALTGSADLQVVSLLIPELRGRGAARLGVRLSGTASEPRLDGSLQLEGATLRARGFPHGIENVRGEARFNEGAAAFSGVRGTVGGGAVELSGEATYQRGRLRSFDVRGRGAGLALRYPEGLRSLVDADLRLFGDRDNQWLTGRIDVRQAVWTRRYDVASELLAESAPAATPAQGEGTALHLDVKLAAPGTLRIDNNLAQLTARAELDLQGTSAAPAVLGRAEVERGRVFFQGNTYLIRRGALEFANPRRIDPLFDIEAEARVRSYRVTLRMNGTLERMYPTFSADPYLSTVQILSLLAGADEATVDSFAALTSRDSAQTRLAAAGAATLAAGRIAEEVGLERGAAKLGLDRFSIDPSIVRGNVSDPTARVTVGKRVTPEMSILYSVDLRGTEERLVSVEYNLSDRFSVLMTRVEPGGFGFDLRVRQSR